MTPPTDWHAPGLVPLVLILIGGWLPAACDVTATGVLSTSVTDSAGIALVEIAGRVGELPEWRIGGQDLAVVRGDAPPRLGGVGEVAILPDGRLVVVDSQTRELHLFDADGTHVRVLGGRGDGPGEFRGVTELTVGEGDSIYAYDRRADRMSVLHPDAGFVRSTSFLGSTGPGFAVGTPPPLDAWPLGRDRTLTLRNGPPDTALLGSAEPVWYTLPSLISVHGPGGALESEIVRVPGSPTIEAPGFSAPAPFGGEPVILVRPDRVIHGSGPTYELYVRDAELRIVRSIRWSGWDEPLTQQEWDSTRIAFRERLLPVAMGRTDIVDDLIGKQFDPDLKPDARPALGPFLLDEAGRIWGSRYEPDGLGSRWHVLDSTGRPLARVTLPEGTELLDVRTDRVALLIRNELDVEEIFVREILR